jgi:hypothetical protein
MSTSLATPHYAMPRETDDESRRPDDESLFNILDKIFQILKSIGLEPESSAK